MDGQLSLFDIDYSNSEFKQYIGKCEYCMWGDDEKTCIWSFTNEDSYSYKQCHSRNLWRPDELKIPRLCGSCKYANCFRYESKPEYKDSVKAAYDPVETPNIYCIKKGGSVNRSQPFLEYYTHNFGVGHWDRQHELDTCDAYEIKDIWEKYQKRRLQSGEGRG